MGQVKGSYEGFFYLYIFSKRGVCFYLSVGLFREEYVTNALYYKVKCVESVNEAVPIK